MTLTTDKEQPRTTETITAEQAHDEHIARLYQELEKAHQQIGHKEAVLYRMAGARTMYSGRTTFWGIQRSYKETVRVTEAIREDILSERDPSERDLTADKTIAQAQQELVDAKHATYRIVGRIDELDRAYTGWSRFFLVTSSAGHIHSSMCCHTCRPTTSYGWLPELSGRTEAEAVQAHGPALCSACFPTAPVDWTSSKITASNAAKAAA